MNKKYIVKLTDAERQRLESLESQGKAAARKIQRAWILLKADGLPESRTGLFSPEIESIRGLTRMSLSCVPMFSKFCNALEL